MDPSRFDRVARDMAASTSRRQALKLLGGSIATGFLTLHGVDQAGAAGCTRVGKKCKKHKECCSGTCCNGVCCAEGLVCQNGTCASPAGPAFLVCICQDNTEIDLCVANDVCNTGPGQDVFCGPACATHGGESATGCLSDDSRCAR